MAPPQKPPSGKSPPRLPGVAGPDDTIPLDNSLSQYIVVGSDDPRALEQLRDIAVDLPHISPALEQLQRRAEAMAQRGIDVDALDFEASYGRTSMEYYDGFVFGFYAERRPDLPPVASGGRYDALTRHLGAGAEIPAVGAVLRPGLMLDLSEAGQ